MHGDRGPNGRPFVFLHVGDLHVTKGHPTAAGGDRPAGIDGRLLARQARMEEDLRAILDDIAEVEPNVAQFVYMPGDLAENGHADEYALIAKAWTAVPRPPLRLVPGDHDRALGSLDAFAAFRRAMVAADPAQNGVMKDGCPSRVDEPVAGWPPQQQECRLPQYYFHEDLGETRCIFLDVVSAGRGQKGWGLDFRLGRGQFEWFVGLLRGWRGGGRTCLVFMHCYPADFHEPDEGDEVASLIWNEGVRLVEMGHTHYSELGHDGRTTYGAARSVGQNEDGPAGYAVVALDDGEVSWRFRQVQQTWPFVAVTSPADRRLATRALSRGEDGTIAVRALVLSGPETGTVACEARVDGGDWHPLTAVSPGVAAGRVPWPDGSRLLQVKATGEHYPGWGKDLIDFDTVEPPPADGFVPRPRPERPGSDACALPSWPEKGIRGDQLGPNKLGRKW